MDAFVIACFMLFNRLVLALVYFDVTRFFFVLMVLGVLLVLFWAMVRASRK